MQTRHYHLYTYIFIGLLSFVIISGGLSWQLIFKKSFAPLAQQQLARIEEQCASSVQPDGFGVIELTESTVIKDETATLSQPCKIILNRDVHLEIINSKVTSNNLLITSVDANAPARVTIENSRLSGNSAGLHIGLEGEGSQITATGSFFEYDLSIGLAAGSKDEDIQSSLFVSNSEFISESPDSEGIVLVATGKATVTGSEFKLSNTDDEAFLLASECSASSNTGINSDCQAE